MNVAWSGTKMCLQGHHVHIRRSYFTWLSIRGVFYCRYMILTLSCKLNSWHWNILIIQLFLDLIKKDTAAGEELCYQLFLIPTEQSAKKIYSWSEGHLNTETSFILT